MQRDDAVFRTAEFRVKRALSYDWITKNPVLGEGEPGMETDTGYVKFGNGMTPWVDLEYILPESGLLARVQAAIDAGEVGDLTRADLVDHIESANPHPAYDDGPSFLLLYQNAKV